MPRLYLITGFLGAGKTTLLKKLIGRLSDKKMAVIVNEFGREGVDGRLLSGLGVAVEEINNGSIFCSCRLDRFEAVLSQVSADGPDIILVEASGLSDPSSVEKVLAQPKFSSVEYGGSICVIDAKNFHRVVDTARVCRKQLAASRMILINKVDLSTEQELTETETRLRALVPLAKLHRCAYGEFDPAWLMEMKEAGASGNLFHTKDVGLQKKLVTIGENMSRYQLQKFLEMFAEDSYRIKGFAGLNGEMYLVDCVGPEIEIKPHADSPAQGVNKLVVLAGPGMPLSKSLDAAVKWYQPYIVSVESGD